ncbi:DEAD/DEAH box helicase [Azospirillum isscasi]|uniref:DEAD/DEAH box helicase n=1 Tax=Azospirillum isscasi TaxID=3053926 RepID=A0ABU0WLH5_9PROT|nr:DEAD/DEAH box helicase [Azospirillum isscasi]MDQ2105075.1 DEAD/DEAH box helicase [Azospirillum isscasi]
MIQELCDQIWANPKFQTVSERLELAWLRKELTNIDVEEDLQDACRLMKAAAILACSSNQQHRKAAFRSATCVYELFGASNLPFDQALRVVLGRLGNFPSLATRAEVESSGNLLPLALATEEAAFSETRKVTFTHQTIYLTDFQHDLWTSLVNKQRVAVAAPTSAGKSFILQNYLASVFEKQVSCTVVYVVPTRALIAQVADDLTAQFENFEGNKPEILTVPLDAEAPLPSRAIYVMTQERVQLALISHSDFSANIIIVDEAHTISDGSRGVLLQWVIDDLLSRHTASQILFASPTIRNLDVFGKLFGLEDVIEFTSVEPTVAQNFLIVSVTNASRGKITVSTAGDGTRKLAEVANIELKQTLASRIEKLLHVSAVLGMGQSNIVYANGPAEAEKIAVQLSDLFSNRATTPEQLALADLAREAIHPKFVLAECVKRGVAFHYANIPTQLRRAIETAVSAGHIDYLVCTSRLRKKAMPGLPVVILSV